MEAELYCDDCGCLLDDELCCPDCDGWDQLNEEDEAWVEAWNYDTYPPPRDEDV